MPVSPAAAVHYRIHPADPAAHLFRVTLTIREPDPAGQRLSLPTWIPGSYMIREFARNIVSIGARRGADGRRSASAPPRGQPVALRKLDKCTWIAAPGDGPLTVSYEVYAWDLSVRAAHLDATHGFFNGTSVFLQVAGRENEPHTVDIEPPQGATYRGWKVATTLPRAGAAPESFGRYRAADYDELIDHPVEIGRFASASFSVGGVRHRIALTGRSDADLDRLCRDLKAICAAQIALFEPVSRRPPVDDYLFMTMAVGDGYGGLEHRASTALICARNDLPHAGTRVVTPDYQRFLGLASHEYFHTWHVKRIKPAAFVPYDLTRESHSELLWIFEGFTSYYDDLMLVRSGVIDTSAYLKSLASTISGVLRGPGRLRQSVAESSFDAWTKYYRQDENAPNAIVSYYAKGALVALALDLSIRQRTRSRRSLDDVMQLLWREYGRDFYRPGRQQRGVAEDEFPEIVERATGLDLRPEIRAWAYGTEELPLARLLDAAGVDYRLKTAEGGTTLGARIAQRDGAPTIATAYNGQSAHRAGLSAGDVLVAIDGLRVPDEATLKAMLGRHRPGERVTVHAFRRDELLEVDVELQAPPAIEVVLTATGDASRAISRKAAATPARGPRRA